MCVGDAVLLNNSVTGKYLGTVKTYDYTFLIFGVGDQIDLEGPYHSISYFRDEIRKFIICSGYNFFGVVSFISFGGGKQQQVNSKYLSISKIFKR